MVIAGLVALGEGALFYATWEAKNFSLLKDLKQAYKEISDLVDEAGELAMQQYSELLDTIGDSLPNHMPPVSHCRRKILEHRINKRLKQY